MPVYVAIRINVCPKKAAVVSSFYAIRSVRAKRFQRLRQPKQFCSPANQSCVDCIIRHNRDDDARLRSVNPLKRAKLRASFFVSASVSCFAIVRFELKRSLRACVERASPVSPLLAQIVKPCRPALGSVRFQPKSASLAVHREPILGIETDCPFKPRLAFPARLRSLRLDPGSELRP